LKVVGYSKYATDWEQDQPGTATYALVSPAYQNDTGIIDNRGIFAPEISLVNLDKLWPTPASTHVQDITSTKGLRSRAQALVDAGAAVNIPGAEAVLNATIDLITTHRRKFPSAPTSNHSTGLKI